MKKTFLLSSFCLILVMLAASCTADQPDFPQAETQKIVPAPQQTLSTPTNTPLPSRSPTPFVCQNVQRSVVLLVEEIYLEPLQAELDQFSRDLCQDGYQVIITPADYDTPQEIRDYLQMLYFDLTEESLVGAILIGDIPHPYLQIRVDFLTEDIPKRYQELITMWYYSDLDGEFALSDNYQPLNGESPLGEPMFDIHPLEGDWEIWVSVLPPYMGDVDETIAALARYFEKNHAYRMGEIDLPRRYIYLTSYEADTAEEHKEYMYHLLEGNLNWSALQGEGEPLLFFNSPTAGLSELDGYQAISAGLADFSVVIGHGTVGSILKINPPWLEENKIQTIFFWTQSCSVGDLDNPYNIMSQVLYHPNSQVLFISGNTTEAGGFGTNENGPHQTNIATSLSQGASLGEAILAHVNTPLVSHHTMNPELTIGPKIFYGDLTLRLWPYQGQ